MIAVGHVHLTCLRGQKRRETRVGVRRGSTCDDRGPEMRSRVLDALRAAMPMFSSQLAVRKGSLKKKHGRRQLYLSGHGGIPRTASRVLFCPLRETGCVEKAQVWWPRRGGGKKQPFCCTYARNMYVHNTIYGTIAIHFFPNLADHFNPTTRQVGIVHTGTGGQQDHLRHSCSCDTRSYFRHQHMRLTHRSIR